MNEHTLFQRAAVALGATIIVPLFVAATGLGGNGVATETRLESYIQNNTQTVKDDENKAIEQKKDESKDTKKPETTSTATQSAGAKAAGSYTVKAGDTYGCIAEKYYGSYDQWSRVYAENGGYPGFEEYRLDVGAKLVMPAVAASEALPKTSLCE